MVILEILHQGKFLRRLEGRRQGQEEPSDGVLTSGRRNSPQF